MLDGRVLASGCFVCRSDVVSVTWNKSSDTDIIYGPVPRAVADNTIDSVASDIAWIVILTCSMDVGIIRTQICWQVL